MIVLITLTVAGFDAGPFNLYSNVDGYVTAFATGITKPTLLAGYTSSVVPDGTTNIRVTSVGTCTNYIDLSVLTTTTTTSSTSSTTSTTSSTTSTTSSTSSTSSTSTTTSTTTPKPTSILRLQSFEVAGLTGGSSSVASYTFNLSNALTVPIQIGNSRAQLYAASTSCSNILGDTSDDCTTDTLAIGFAGNRVILGDYNAGCSAFFGWNYRIENDPTGAVGSKGVDVNINGAGWNTYYNGDVFDAGGTDVTIEIAHITPSSCTGFANCT